MSSRGKGKAVQSHFDAVYQSTPSHPAENMPESPNAGSDKGSDPLQFPLDEGKRPVRPSKARRNYTSIMKLRDKLLRTQTSVEYERDVLKAKKHTLNKALSNVSSLIEDVEGKDNEIGSAALARWKQQVGQTKEDLQAFEAQLDIVDEQEQRAFRTMYQISRLEPKLLKKLDKLFRSDPEDDQTPENEAFPLYREPSPEPDYHPLAREYYETRGNIRLLQDQLFNHMVELRMYADDQGRTSQDVKAEASGAEGSMSFQKSWRDQHDPMRHDLDENSEKLTRLWHECQAQNLDVGDLDEELAMNAKLMGDDDDDEDFPAGQQIENDPPVDQDEDAYPPETHDFVDRWVNELRPEESADPQSAPDNASQASSERSAHAHSSDQAAAAEGDDNDELDSLRHHYSYL